MPGNLFASFVTTLDCPPAKAGQLSLVAGVAVIDAIRRAGDVPGLRLKWPNDILVGTAKTGGILVESTSRPRAAGTVAVIGIGLNLVSAPDRPRAEPRHFLRATDYRFRRARRCASWRRP